MDDKRFLIWFQLVFGIANPRSWSILNRFESLESAYVTLKSGECKLLSEKEKQNVSQTELSKADEIINQCNQQGYNIVTYFDELYPDALKGIYNAPLVLYYMGDLSFLRDNVAITVVGTRNPSAYSVKVAQKICTELSKVGMIIVSGFALGIDSMAHRSALQTNGRTVAVLGCGLNANYPKPNSPIKKVIAKHGAVISEFFPDTTPIGPNFPKRNRILSALGMGTLVIEAAMGSGSLITADYAIEQGKDIFCIPPADIFDNRYSGVIKYLRDGAIPTFSHLDVIYEYFTTYSHRLKTAQMLIDYYQIPTESMIFSLGNNKNNQEAEASDKKSASSSKKKRGKQSQQSEADTDKASSQRQADTDKASSKAEVMDSEEKSSPEFTEDDFTSEQLEIIRIIKSGVTHVDDISAELQMDILQIFELLTELEILGCVKAMPGKCYNLAWTD